MEMFEVPCEFLPLISAEASIAKCLVSEILVELERANLYQDMAHKDAVLERLRQYRSNDRMEKRSQKIATLISAFSSVESCIRCFIREILEKNSTFTEDDVDNSLKHLQERIDGLSDDELTVSTEAQDFIILPDLREVLKNSPTAKNDDDAKAEFVGNFSDMTIVPKSLLDKSSEFGILTILMVAEKPTMARQIATQLSSLGKDNYADDDDDGYRNVYEFMGEFMGRRAYFKMTSTFGHVMRTEFQPEFQNRHSHEPEELFSCPIEKIECENERTRTSVRKALAEKARRCDYVVLWLDCDLEGENICFEVIDAIRDSLNKHESNVEDQIFRAHFSSINDVERAFKNLTRANLNQSLTVDARQELDLRIGVAFSRFQTRYFRRRYPRRAISLVSFGPCQTPTLAFCVEQHEKVENFKPEFFFTISCNITINDAVVKLKYASGAVKSREECDRMLKVIKTVARLSEVNQKMQTKSQPKPMNTFELLKASSSRLEMSPIETMKASQKLYQKGLISYPRTETSTYQKDLPARELLERSIGNDQLQKWSNGQLSLDALYSCKGELREPRQGVDKGDHPPIYPIGRAPPGLPDDEKRVLEYVGQHFVASFMDPCTYNTTRFVFSVGEGNDNKFHVEISKLINPGFTVIMPDQGITSDNQHILESLSVGSEFTISDIQIHAEKTTLPQHLTESELIAKMEQYSIGTDGSVASHIDNIMKSYVTLESGRRLVPTPLGIALIRAYRELDEELALPTVRADVERKLAKIARGEAEFGAVRDEILNLYHAKFKSFILNFNKVEHLFEGCFPFRANDVVSSSSENLSTRIVLPKRNDDCERVDDFVETHSAALSTRSIDFDTESDASEMVTGCNNGKGRVGVEVDCAAMQCDSNETASREDHIEVNATVNPGAMDGESRDGGIDNGSREVSSVGYEAKPNSVVTSTDNDNECGINATISPIAIGYTRREFGARSSTVDANSAVASREFGPRPPNSTMNEGRSAGRFDGSERGSGRGFSSFGGRGAVFRAPANFNEIGRGRGFGFSAPRSVAFGRGGFASFGAESVMSGRGGLFTLRGDSNGGGTRFADSSVGRGRGFASVNSTPTAHARADGFSPRRDGNNGFGQGRGGFTSFDDEFGRRVFGRNGTRIAAESSVSRGRGFGSAAFVNLPSTIHVRDDVFSHKLGVISGFGQDNGGFNSFGGGGGGEFGRGGFGGPRNAESSVGRGHGFGGAASANLRPTRDDAFRPRSHNACVANSGGRGGGFEDDW